MKIFKLAAILMSVFLLLTPRIYASASEQELDIQDYNQEQKTEQNNETVILNEETADEKDEISEDIEDIKETEEAVEAVEESKAIDETKEAVEESKTIDETKEAEEIKATKKTEETKATKETKKETKPAYTEDELRLLAAIIYCEAQGEPYAGKLAVGIVVMNRKKSDLFPNTIKNVIYQKNQFGPAKNGTLAKALKRYDDGKFTSKAQKECIKAAKEALNGAVKVTYKDKTYSLKNYFYFNGRVKNHKLQIANHQFK